MASLSNITDKWCVLYTGETVNFQWKDGHNVVKVWRDYFWTPCLIIIIFWRLAKEYTRTVSLTAWRARELTQELLVDLTSGRQWRGLITLSVGLGDTVLLGNRRQRLPWTKIAGTKRNIFFRKIIIVFYWNVSNIFNIWHRLTHSSYILNNVRN